MPSAPSPDWRADTIDRVRTLIRQADPDAVEEIKWRKPSNNMRGVPVWSHDGIICTGETYKDTVKLTFAKGAALDDPRGLFNASLSAGTRRAIDLHEGDRLNAAAFKALIRAAVALNTGGAASKRAPKKAVAKETAPKPASSKPKLLSGGNPQIPKADGDAPVQAYIAAIPGWKRAVCRDLDALITRSIPKVRKAVRWNSPFYGVEGSGWFLCFHCFTRYVKVTFLNGASLRPPPPVGSKDPSARYLHIHESEAIDEKQLTAWLKQASRLPGWDGFKA